MLYKHKKKQFAPKSSSTCVTLCVQIFYCIISLLSFCIFFLHSRLLGIKIRTSIFIHSVDLTLVKQVINFKPNLNKIGLFIATFYTEINRLNVVLKNKYMLGTFVH